MDGLLIDSEPLWLEAKMTVMRSLGVPLTREMGRQAVGLRLDAVVRQWYAAFPWQGAPPAEVEASMLDRVSRLIVERAGPMPGAVELIERLDDAGLVLAVASSSPLALIRTVLDRLGVTGRFAVLHSAENEAEGKPDPAVYRTAIGMLGVAAAQCVAFEDSQRGVLAAKRAGAMVVAVPDPAEATDPAFAIADLVLASLEEFSLDRLEQRVRGFSRPPAEGGR
jgi:sugar-phosphatase